MQQNSILCLSKEILRKIVHIILIDQDPYLTDICSLRCTCSFLKTLMDPILFHRIPETYFADQALSVVESNYSVHVQKADHRLSGPLCFRIRAYRSILPQLNLVTISFRREVTYEDFMIFFTNSKIKRVYFYETNQLLEELRDTVLPNVEKIILCQVSITGSKFLISRVFPNLKKLHINRVSTVFFDFQNLNLKKIKFKLVNSFDWSILDPEKKNCWRYVKLFCSLNFAFKALQIFNPETLRILIMGILENDADFLHQISKKNFPVLRNMDFTYTKPLQQYLEVISSLPKSCPILISFKAICPASKKSQTILFDGPTRKILHKRILEVSDFFDPKFYSFF